MFCEHGLGVLSPQAQSGLGVLSPDGDPGLGVLPPDGDPGCLAGHFTFSVCVLVNNEVAAVMIARMNE